MIHTAKVPEPEIPQRVPVPGSTFAFDLGGRQVCHVVVVPKQPKPIRTIELVKGGDGTAPIVLAVTAEML